MNMPPNPTPRAGGPLPLAESLLKTLQEEQETLARLESLFAAHRDALRENRQDLLEEATNRTNDLVSALARLRQARDRQMRLLGRVLHVEGEAPSLVQIADAIRPHEGGEEAARQLLDQRRAIHAHAARAQQQCGELEFALNYAIDLGREMLQAIQGVDAATAPARVYTPKGASAQPSTQHSFLNTLG